MTHLHQNCAPIRKEISRKSIFFSGKKRPDSCFFQPKLTVGPTDDIYEREADTVADQVMKMSENPFIQPKISSVALQRKCAACEEKEKVQRKTHPSAIQEAPAEVHQAIHSGGQSMDEGTRSFMENRFGYDFSKVKIHTDTIAAKSAEAINALAYTSGNDVVFKKGEYAPGTDDGKRLLAHELTHVVQQGNKNKNRIQKQGSTQLNQGGPSTPLEVGQVVRVEVRAGAGDIEPMTHNYPVSPNGCLNLPMIGCIRARGKTPTQVREAINQALIDGEFYNNPTVNVSFVNKTVDYSHRVSAGESIFIRALETDGRMSFSGNFPIDSDGKIHIPMVGDLIVQGQNFSTIETTIKNRLISGQFLNSPTVHVAGSAI